MDEIIILIRENTQWLYTRLYDTKFLYIDLWSFVHLWSGMVVFLLLLAFGVKRYWLWLLLLLIFYEVVEQGIVIIGFRIFYIEKIVDVINDIIVGFSSAVLINFLIKSKNEKAEKFTEFYMPVILSSATISYLWVGNYKYLYVIPAFNSAGISWWALLCWFLGGVAIIAGYKRIAEFVKNKILSSAISWSLYFVILILLEYIGYFVFELKEIGHASHPLLFNIIHGTPGMHFFYLSAPFIFIILFELFNTLIIKATNRQK